MFKALLFWRKSADNAGGAQTAASASAAEPAPASAAEEASGTAVVEAGTGVAAMAEAVAEEAAAEGGLLASASAGQLALVSVLAGGILAMVALGVYYRLTGSPVSSLPGLSVVAKQLPPHYLTSILGSTQPLGVAVTPDGDRIYAVESDGERLTVAYERTGKALSKLAPPGTTEGKRLPMYAAIDPSGRLYVTDRMRQVVDVYDPLGKYLMGMTIVDDKQDGVIPLGINYAGKDRAGKDLLAITEANATYSRVLLTALDGKLLRAMGGDDGPAKLNYPNAAVLDKQGRLFVADGNANRVAIFAADGKFAGEFGRGDKEGSVGVPRGLYLDGQSRLHVVDLSSHEVVVYDVSGQPTYLFTFGGFGIGNGQFNFPGAIAGDTQGRLYIADTQTGRVQMWAY